MDMNKTSAETGLFEAAKNLSLIHNESFAEICRMPMPSSDISERTRSAAQRLAALGKEKILLLTPELALIDELSEISSAQILIAVPCDMDAEARARLEMNLPKKMPVMLLYEPFFPEDFYPSNAVIVICGYLGGGRAMIFPETYRLAEHYDGFRGKKVFISYVETAYTAHRDGWIEMNTQNFSEIWRHNHEHCDF